MTTVFWKAAAGSHDWNTPQDWSAGVLPTALDTVSLATSVVNTITVGSGDVETVAAITSATTGSNDAITIAGGSLTVAGAATFGGGLTINSGWLNLYGAGAVSNGFTLKAGVKFGAPVTLTLSGAGAISGADFSGPGTVVTTGTASLGGGSTSYVGAGATWLVQGTVNQGGGNLILDESSAGAWAAGTLSIAATGVFNLTDDSAIDTYGGVAGSLVNAGLLEKTGGAGVSQITDSVTTTGVIKATSGTLNLTGGGILGGTVSTSGAGVVELGGGTFTLGSTSVSLGGPITIAGGATVQTFSGQTLAFVGGRLSGGDLTGTASGGKATGGVVATTGTVALGAGSTSYVGAGATWLVKGTVNQLNGNLILDDASSGQWMAGMLSIASTGVFDLTDDSAIDYYNGVVGSVINAGILEKTGGANTSIIRDRVTSTGVIEATSGTLDLAGGGVLGGTFVTTGGGVVELGGGTFTLGSSAVSLGGPATIAGATVKVGSGQTLTFGGGRFSGGDITGAVSGGIAAGGVVATTGTVSLNGNATYVGTGATWQVKGTVNQGNATLYLDDQSSGHWLSGTLSIVSTGVFNLTDNSAIDYASGVVGAVTNAGLLEKTGGTGVSRIADVVTTTGVIKATSGILDLTGGGVLGGVFSTANGGVIELGGGTFTLGSSAVSLGGPATIAGATVKVLAGQTLTIAGGGFSGGDITGVAAGGVAAGGTVATTGTVSLGGGAASYVGTGATWQVQGTVNQGNGTLYLADSSSGRGMAGTLSIAATGVFDLTDDSAIDYSSSAIGLVANAGLLEKTGGTGVSRITDAVTSTGVIKATSGTLDLTGGGILGGTFTTAGGGVIELGGGTFTIASTSVSLGGPATIAGATVKALSGQTLTIAGGAFSGGDITGFAAGGGATGGMVATTGTVTLGAYSSSYVGTGATWRVLGTVNQGNGTLYLDDSSSGQWMAGTLRIASTGVYDLTDDSAIDYSNGAIGLVVNAGLLEKTGGTGVSRITDSVTSFGVIKATSGTLDLTGGGVLGGTFATSGGGVIELGGGTFTIASSSASLGGPATIAGATVQLLSGQTLTIAGGAFSGGDITGDASGGAAVDGVFATTGTVTLGANASSYVGTGATWLVQGTVNQGAGTLYLDDSSSGSWMAGTLSIASTGVFDLTDDSGVSYISGAVGSIVNAGVLEKTGGTGVSTIADSVTGAGVIKATSGTLNLTGGGVLGGTFATSGGGVIKLGGGAFTLASASVSLGGPAAIAGASIQVLSGQTLTIAGGAFSGGDITGAAAGGKAAGGTVATTGTVTLGSNATSYVGTGATWLVQGTVNQGAGNLVLDDQSGGHWMAGTLSIASTGVFDLTDDSDIVHNYNAAGSILNAGLLEKTGGTGVSVIGNALANTGDGGVLVSSGTLDIQGAVSGTGMETISGAAKLEFDSTVGDSSAPHAQNIVFAGAGVLDLHSPQTFWGEISNFASNDAIDLLGSWSYSNFAEVNGVGELTLTNGSATHRFDFIGAFTSSSFHIASGGTTVITHA